MLDALKDLLQGSMLSESAQQQISEAWEQKLHEARQEIVAEMREEFAGKYEHDKAVMTQALNKLVSESLKSELTEFAQERKAVAEDRVRGQRKLKETASKLEKFVTGVLAEEIKDLRIDRAQYKQSLTQLESFVNRSLKGELKEFARDKQAVVEARVKLVTEGKKQLAQLKQQFIDRSARAVQEHIKASLNTELTQLRESIEVARENEFGRKIFEAFAGEFTTSVLNENQSIKQMRSQMQKMEQKLAESNVAITASKKLAESRTREAKKLNESIARERKLNSLMKSLSRDKAETMHALLESVQTDRLDVAFKKYLPAVVSGKDIARAKPLVESKREVTGNKRSTLVESKKEQADESVSNIIDIKRLAGLNR